MTNGEARLREALKRIKAGSYWSEFVAEEVVVLNVVEAEFKKLLAAPVQAEVESRSVQRRKALQRGEAMPTFKDSVRPEVGEARTNGVACPAQMNQLNGRWEIVSTAGTGGASLAAIIEKLREDAHQMESPYWTKKPLEPNWGYIASAFRQIACDLERALASRREMGEGRLTAFLQAEITEHQRQNNYADVDSANYNANLAYIDAYRLVLAFIEGKPTWERGARAALAGEGAGENKSIMQCDGKSFVDALAAQIRRIDGAHAKGAGAIAEELAEWLTEKDNFPK